MPLAPSPRREHVLFAAGVAAIVALAASLRLPGLAPPSLFLDDVWVALLAREASLADLLTLRPPHPAGFMALQILAHRLLPGAELSVQLVPFAASLALIPLGGWLVWRRAGSVSGGLLAAALLALNPTLSDHSVRVKPYATDALLSLVLVAVTLRCLAEPSSRRLWRLALLAPLAILLSYPAALAGAVGFAVAFSSAALSTRDRGPLTRIAGVFVAAEATLGALFVLGQSNETLRSFWQTEFMPLETPAGALMFIASRTAFVILGSFPPGWRALGILAPLAVALLFRRRETRPAGALLAALWAAFFAAAAARLYPMDGRTAAFAFPLVALLAAWTISSVFRRASSPLVREAVPAFLAAAILLTSAVPVTYPPFEDARLVRALVSEARPGDAVLLYPHANWGAAYYSGWSVRLVRADYYGTRYEARLLREGSVTLPGLPGYVDRPRVLDPALFELVSRNPARVLYLATHLEVDCCAAHVHIQQVLGASGYASERLAVARGGELIRFALPPPPPRSTALPFPIGRGSPPGPGASKQGDP